MMRSKERISNVMFILALAVLVPTVALAQSVTVDGLVTDGSGGGYPLYARVDVSSTGGTFALYTNPVSGHYAFSALVGTAYTITVTAQLTGYDPQTRNVTTGTTDRQESFALTVNQAACNAPGYTIQNIAPMTADFESGIPAGWTVTNTTTNCNGNSIGYSWTIPDWTAVSSMPEGGNLTGGSGMFAVANSDACGPSVHMDTTLESPPIDLTNFSGNVQVQFNSDYFDLCSPNMPNFDTVTLDIWTGSAWSTIFNFCGQLFRRGPRLESFVTAAGDGAISKIRWHYKTVWDWWWQIDNVAINTGPACIHIVQNTPPPTLAVPANITLDATSPSGATVSFVVTASDIVDPHPAVFCSFPSGTTFPIGTTTVQCTATDAAGNTSPASFTVTVRDTTPPILTVPGNMTVDATSPSGATVNFVVTASDNVDPHPMVSCSFPSGTTFPIGTTTVQCTATDAAGNSSTGSFTVTINSASAQTANLVTLVQTFNLAQGINNSLDSKLQNIQAALTAANSGNRTNACSQLVAFVNSVMAQSGNHITTDQANQLIANANQIRAVLGC